MKQVRYKLFVDGKPAVYYNQDDSESEVQAATIEGLVSEIEMFFDICDFSDIESVILDFGEFEYDGSKFKVVREEYETFDISSADVEVLRKRADSRPEDEEIVW